MAEGTQWAPPFLASCGSSSCVWCKLTLLNSKFTYFIWNLQGGVTSHRDVKYKECFWFDIFNKNSMSNYEISILVLIYFFQLELCALEVMKYSWQNFMYIKSLCLITMIPVPICGIRVSLVKFQTQGHGCLNVMVYSLKHCFQIGTHNVLWTHVNLEMPPPFLTLS